MMRQGLVGVGVLSLLVSGLAAAPAAAAVPQASTAADVIAQAVTPGANPSIEETCGLDATLILDASGSISSAGAVNTVRNAGYDMLDALKDTNSTLRITQFGTFSGQLSQRVPVNAATTGTGGSLATGMASYYTPPPPRPAGVTIYNGNQVQNTALTWTNWQDSIQAIDKPELAIYITDGDPTAYNVSSSRTNVNVSSTGVALDNAVTAANTLKASGTRMLVVGVGNGLSNTASQNRLKQISGPQLEKSAAALAGKTINQVDAVAFSDFAALGDFLRSVVTSLCGNSVTVQKLAQSSAGSAYEPAAGWDVTVQPTVSGGFAWVDPIGPDNSAQTRATAGVQGATAFQWKPKVASQKATVRVSEAVKSDFDANRWTCDVKTADGKTTTVSGNLTNGDPSFQFDMNPSDLATCKLYNDFDYQPGIEITKTAQDDPVRGNANGWNETYTFTVRNTGNTPLTVVKPVDPKCTSISNPTGPGAASGKLQPGDEWTYTCEAKIGPVATVTTPLTHTNTVSVTGIAPDGGVVSAQDQRSVDVKTPRIAIVKTAKKFNGAPIPPDGTVPAGTKVTYVYTVTNTGNDTLNLVRATAVTDNKCGPVDYKSGDTGDDQALSTTETWIYECTKVLNPPSSVSSVTNVASVTSTWSNPQNRSQNDGAVTDNDSMTINVVRAANLRIVKVTNPGEASQDFGFTVSGQGVPVDDESFTLNTAAGPASAPASRNISLDGPDGSGSQYTITEAATGGWKLTDLKCDKTPDSVELVTGEIKVTIMPEEDVTCTYTNERLPSLTITKQTSPDGANADFGFNASAPLYPFTLSDGESQVFSNLTPGAVTITENDVPAGWDLDDISCSGTTVVSKDIANGVVTVELAYAEEADCVYTNAELAPATLTVVKDDVPATWDPSFDFNASGNGLVDPGQPGSDDFTLGLGDSKSYTVRPGVAGDTYAVTEGVQPTPPGGDSGFDLTDIECVVNGVTTVPGNVVDGKVQVTLRPGDSAVCTYVNQQKPRLTIVKNVVNPEDLNDSTAFTFTPLGLTPGGDFDLGNGDEKVFADVTPDGALTVTEQSEPNWTLTSLECTGRDADGLTVDSLTGVVSGDLPYGADAVCTYVNTATPADAYLFVLKNTDPPNDPASFDFNATNGDTFDEDFSLQGGDYQGFTVNPGLGGDDYTVTEDGAAGWKLTELDCVVSTDPATIVPGDVQAGEVTVTLEPGEVGVCVYENQKLGTLSVDKVITTNSTRDFDFTALGTPDALDPSTFVLQGGQAQTYSDIPAGNEITITEEVPTVAPDRWSLSKIVCDGTASPAYNLAQGKATFTIGAGEDVDCTYSDAKVPSATVQIVKAADPADGTEFDFTASGADGGVSPADQSFSLAPDGDIAVKTLTVNPAADGEEFTFAEPSVPDDWKLKDLKCVDQGIELGSPDVSASGGEVVVDIDPGDTITCTFTDVKDATLTVVKEAPDDPSESFDFTWTVGPDFTLKDQERETDTGLAAGDYTVAEFDLPADWYLDGPNGEHPTCTGTAAAVDYSPELGAKITLAPGEEAVCSFADFFEYDPQITLVKTPDRSVVLEGKPVVYSYTVTNTGNVEVEPVGDLADVVTDDQCDDVRLVTGTRPLGPGDQWTFECTVASMTPAKATNLATATVKDPLDPQKTLQSTDEQTVEVRVPALTLRKSVDKPVVYAGTDVTYTYLASNSGATPFEGPTNKDEWMSDNKCAPVTYLSGDVGDDSILGVGEAWTYECSTTIDIDTENTGTVTGTPFVPASPESGDKQTGDPIPATDTAKVEVIVKDIDIAKTASAPGGVMKDGALLVPIGTEVTYSYEVTSGDATVPMKVLDVTDNTCSPVEYQSGDSNDNGLVDPGETWLYTCKTTFAGATTVTNTAVVTALEPIVGGIATKSDQATVTSYRGSLAIKKTPSAQLVEKGTPVTYTYLVTNDGTVDLTDVTVRDDKCVSVVATSGGEGVMKPGDQWTYQCISALEQDVTNIADATGTTPSGGKVTDSTSATVLVVGGRLNPAIAVVKTASASSVRRGNTVTYTYDVTNVGTMPLANIRVSDDKCAPVTYVKGDDNGDGLLTNASSEGWPDETWVYTCTTTLTGNTTNTVTAVGSPWDGGKVVGKDVSAQAQVRVTVTKPKAPIDVKPAKKCKGNPCTVVKRSKTNKQNRLKYRVKCRPIKSSAQGEVSFCRTKITKKGAVKVDLRGYRKAKVTVWITAKPKPKYRDNWRPQTWKRTWVIRP